MSSAKRFPPAMPDQVLCKAHLRARLEERKAKWMQQREHALGSDDLLPDESQSGETVSLQPPPSLSPTERGPERDSPGVAPPLHNTSEAVAVLCELGFSRCVAEAALEGADGELEVAVERLLACASDEARDDTGVAVGAAEEVGRPSAARPRLPPPISAAGAAAIRRAEATAQTASTASCASAGGSSLILSRDSLSGMQTVPLSPASEHSELAEMNDFLAALELQQGELEHL